MKSLIQKFFSFAGTAAVAAIMLAMPQAADAQHMVFYENGNAGIADINGNGKSGVVDRVGNIEIIDGEVYIDGINSVTESGDGSGHNKSKPVKMTDCEFEVSSEFDSIVTVGFVNVVFTQSDKDCEVRGRLPEKLIGRMNVEVSDRTLHISMKPGTYGNFKVSESPTIYISNKTLKDVSFSGSGDFMIKGNLKASDGFSVRSSGSGDFKSGKINSLKKQVSVSTSGSGDVEISGVESGSFIVHLSGSADVDCGTVKTKTSSIEINGSGDVRISGKADSVELAVTGTGDIGAYGFKAKTGKASVAGTGDIWCNVKRLSKRVSGTGGIHNKY